MYKSGYVVSVRQGSQTIKEDQSGKVELPFNEEYEVRLRNKNGKDCIAFVYIDGKVVVKDGLIVRAHSFIDLERYVENLDKGNRFKFVSIKDSRVSDKTEPDNGIIEVRFHEVKDQPKPLSFNDFGHSCHSSYCWNCGRMHCSCRPCSYPMIPMYPKHNWYDPYDMRPTYTPPIVWCRGSQPNNVSNHGRQCYSQHKVSGASGVNCSVGTNYGASVMLSGATIRGSISSQKFSETSVEYCPEVKAIITLRLMWNKKEVVKVKESEGKKIVFCSACGAKRQGKYCVNCGEELH